VEGIRDFVEVAKRMVRLSFVAVDPERRLTQGINPESSNHYQVFPDRRKFALTIYN